MVCVCEKQGFELMLLSLGDLSERVVSATHQVFIPAFAAWSTELGNLQSQLIPSLLNRIEKLLQVTAHTPYSLCSCLFCVVHQSLTAPIISIVELSRQFTE